MNVKLEQKRSDREMSWENCLKLFDKLTFLSVIGFYNSFDIVEIVAFQKENGPINLLSLFVAQEEAATPAGTWLNDSRIKLKNLPDWSFGIYRYSLSVGATRQAIENYIERGEWTASGNKLEVGRLAPLVGTFVPPDDTERPIWNRVLKNNFWNGSHIIELADPNKQKVAFFFDDRISLQELSAEITKLIPIRIASLSDRLGNIIIQLPVTVIAAQFYCRQKEGDFYAEIAWHPKAPPRPLRAHCEIMFDGVISTFASGPIEGQTASLPIAHSKHFHRGVIWDDAHQVILSATAGRGLITSINFNMHLVSSQQEPRQFFIEKNGELIEQKIALSGPKTFRQIGTPSDDGNGGWTDQRLYTDELADLTQQRRFVQYGLGDIDPVQEHRKALDDLRVLINQHGEGGAWLWDPYLSADDVLETLFYCRHDVADLRALTATLRIKECDESKSISKSKWIQKQQDQLERCKGNVRSLRLEYRAKVGPAGYNFHDRFLIFPGIRRGAQAWSLGTSVNSAGKQHHILQKCADGQMVMDAFEKLWKVLDQDQHLVWKTP